MTKCTKRGVIGFIIGASIYLIGLYLSGMDVTMRGPDLVFAYIITLMSGGLGAFVYRGPQCLDLL